MPRLHPILAAITLLALLAPRPATATPTTVFVDETIVFASGDQASLFPVGQPFRITYTWDPETPDLDGMVNGGGAYPGSISAMTIELAGLVFEYGGGPASNVLTSDDQGAIILVDGVALLPGSYVSGLLDGLTPNDIEIEATLQAAVPPGPVPDMIVDDVLQNAFAFDFITVTFDAVDGTDLLTTVVSAGPGTAEVPEPSLVVLAACAGLGLLALPKPRSPR